MSLRRNSLLVIALASLGAFVACTDAGSDASATFDPLSPAVQRVTEHTLLECPVEHSVSTSGAVGLLGGTLGLAGVSLEVPLGTLALPQRFRMEIPASQYMEVSISAIGFGHYLFAGPVTVTIDYSRCSDSVLARGPLTVYYIDEVTKELLQNMGGVDDRANRRITFTTDHLSGYAIAN